MVVARGRVEVAFGGMHKPDFIGKGALVPFGTRARRVALVREGLETGQKRGGAGLFSLPGVVVVFGAETTLRADFPERGKNRREAPA